LRNLLQNAVKYSPEGTEIVISGEARQGEVQVHVADAGIGISEEDQGRYSSVSSELTVRQCAALPAAGWVYPSPRLMWRLTAAGYGWRARQGWGVVSLSVCYWKQREPTSETGRHN